MTRDDIIRMAREAGFAGWLAETDFVTTSFERFAALVAAEKDKEIMALVQAAALVAAAEREACAELCQEMEDRENPYERNVAVLDCASAIRARGEP